jgi:predicted nuclease with TOPRIM domain
MTRIQEHKQESRDASMRAELESMRARFARLEAQVARLEPLKEEVARLQYNFRKTNNELYKLKDSIM